ncbi:MAG: pyridoxal-phosphate dependent enzyme [Bacteroidetes bacterium]|nr:pyridoxal-phosphate dependent enzyme [Bacteroidota bacterium]
MINNSVPIQKINSEYTSAHDIHLYVYRLDLNHQYISGNKLHKLHYNLLEVKKQNITTLLTFGGAFSNHIAATAAAGKEHGLKTIGIIRGEEYSELNPTLTFAKMCGMELHYVSRKIYQNKETLYKYVSEKFSEQNYYLIPEGGSNNFGVLGCMEITKNIPIDFDIICCPCGTGATISGITLSLKEHQQSIGFQILKAENYIEKEVSNWLKIFNSNQKNWEINESFHFGGYAKLKPELLNFIKEFEKEHSVPFDYIYTGKMMFGITEMIKNGFFKKGQTIVAVHTGGLQGNEGFKN